MVITMSGALSLSGQITLKRANISPVWLTSNTSPLATVGTSESVNTSVLATDEDSFPSALTYTVTIGSLPTGLNLNPSTGAITGTTTTATTAFFTIEASDGLATVTRQFQIIVNAGFDLNTASFASKSLSVNAQESSPRGVALSEDGTKAYVVGIANTVFQYTLSTPFDLSTGFFTLGKDVSAQSIDSDDIFFKDDGTKMYLTSSGFDFQPNFDRIHQYTLATAWNITTATYDSLFDDVNAEDNAPNAIWMKDDGTKYWMTGNENNTVHQYTMSTPFNISTGTADGVSKDVTLQDTKPKGIFFNPTGTRMFICGNNNATIFEYALSTPFVVSSASYSGVNLSVSEDASPTSIHFSPDGTKLYVLGQVNNSIFQYTIT